ncbi:MAG: methyltransferase [Clostridia bacterium]|nr:methyltransferase [Clostridia bacterium]
MAEQYYTQDPTCESRPVPCEYDYRGQRIRCMTDAGVFSKGELDQGTRLLIDALPELKGAVLDLGCGWGAIGVALGKANPEAQITMADVNRRALELARSNAQHNGVKAECVESDGMSALMNRRFRTAVTNPPIRAGKQVIYQMFADIAGTLEDEGELYLVIRKQQGAESCMKYLKTLYGDVEKVDKSAGFWVLKASGPIR